MASVGDPASKDLSNVTSISSSSAVQTALNAKAAKDLSNGSKATQANINNIMPDAMDYVVDSYSDEDGTWYRRYKSGWLEQGGVAQSQPNNDMTFTFLKPFADISYVINKTLGDQTGEGNNYTTTAQTRNWQIWNKTVSSFTTAVSSTNISFGFTWYACGQGAE